MSQIILGLIELGLGLWGAFAQMGSSHAAIVSMLQSGIAVDPHMKAADALAIFTGEQSRDEVIAWSIAIIVECALMFAIFPGSILARMPLFRALLLGYVIFDIITDAWFAVAFTTPLNGVMKTIFTGGIPGVIVTIIYVGAMLASPFFAVSGLHTVSAGTNALMRASASGNDSTRRTKNA